MDQEFEKIIFIFEIYTFCLVNGPNFSLIEPVFILIILKIHFRSLCKQKCQLNFHAPFPRNASWSHASLIIHYDFPLNLSHFPQKVLQSDWLKLMPSLYCFYYLHNSGSIMYIVSVVYITIDLLFIDKGYCYFWTLDFGTKMWSRSGPFLLLTINE